MRLPVRTLPPTSPVTSIDSAISRAFPTAVPIGGTVESAAAAITQWGFVVTPEQLYHQVLNTLADTLGGMRDFAGDIKGVRGPILEIAYPPKGLLGVGGHFDAAQQTVLRSAVRVVRATPGLKEGWSLAYRYDRGARVLRVRAGSEGDNALEGFTSLQ